MIGTLARVLAIAAFAACGREAHQTPDAGPTDASIDMLQPQEGDAPASAVMVRVTRGGAPVAGVAAFFQDASSQLIASKLTNEIGIAWADVPDGGFVTTLEHEGSGLDELTTFAAVKAGDRLRLDRAPTGSTTIYAFQVTFPADTIGGAAGYVVHTSCGGEPFGFVNPAPPSNEPQNEMLLTNCPDDGAVDFVIHSVDGEGNPLRALYAGNVSLPAPVPPSQFTDAGTPAPLAVLPIQTGTYAPLEQHVLNYTNVPAELTYVGVNRAVPAAHRAFEQSTGNEPNVTRAARAEVYLPAGAPSVFTSTVGFPRTGEFGQPMILDWGMNDAAYALDVGSALLSVFGSAPKYDPATHAVTWSERTGGITPDVVRTRIHVHRDAIPSGRSWGWRMIAPRAATTVTYPVLPVAEIGFDFNPQATDAFGVDELTTAKLPGGYDGWRARGFTDFPRAITGTSGRITVQTLFFDPCPPETGCL